MKTILLTFSVAWLAFGADTPPMPPGMVPVLRSPKDAASQPVKAMSTTVSITYPTPVTGSNYVTIQWPCGKTDKLYYPTNGPLTGKFWFLDISYQPDPRLPTWVQWWPDGPLGWVVSTNATNVDTMRHLPEGKAWFFRLRGVAIK